MWCHGSAHSERILLEQLQLRAAAATDPAVRAVMCSVASLFALWTMERDLKWFVLVDVLNTRDVHSLQVRWGTAGMLTIECVSIAISPAIPHLLVGCKVGWLLLIRARVFRCAHTLLTGRDLAAVRGAEGPCVVTG